MSRAVLWILALVAITVSACGSGNAKSCVQGAEGCPCLPKNGCQLGLSCRSKLCVDLGPGSVVSHGATAGNVANASAQPWASGGAAGKPASNVDHAAGAAGSARSNTPATQAMGDSADSGADGAAAASGGAGRASAGIGGAAGVGAMGTPATAGTGGAALACVKPGGNCAGAPCCDAALCVQNVCAADCTRNDECISACCFALNSGMSVCAPTNLCPAPDAPDCVRDGADCSAHTCCGGVFCIQNVCASQCSGNNDCASECCYQSLCAPASLCAQPQPIAGTGGGSVPTGTVIESRIDGEFTGWTGQTVFKLQNGQYWQQVSYAYTYHYAYSPAVTIAKEGSSYRLRVDGVNDSITVELLDVVVASQITGEFNGWDGDTVFPLANGQVWRQSGPGVTVNVAVLPDVVIYSKGGYFEMSVEGIDSVVQVTQVQ